MSEINEYQQLVEQLPELQNAAHREAFEKYIEQMWTKPSSFRDYMQAYLEFTTPKKLTFSKLNAMQAAKQKNKGSSSQKRGRRRSRRGRRRSNNRNKKN